MKTIKRSLRVLLVPVSVLSVALISQSVLADPPAANPPAVAAAPAATNIVQPTANTAQQQRPIPAAVNWSANDRYRASEDGDGGAERDENGSFRYIIPFSQIESRFIKRFQVSLDTREDGSTHLAVHGFIPRGCAHNLSITRPNWNRAANRYEFRLEGVGEENWRQCFEDWSSAPHNHSCSRAETNPAWQCIDVGSSEIQGLEDFRNFALAESGDVSLRIEPRDLDGQPAFHSFSVNFVNASDQERLERRTQLISLCSSARTGGRSDIEALREFGIQNDLPNAVTAATQFERTLAERERQEFATRLQAVISRNVSTLDDIQTKLNELVQMGDDPRASTFRDRVGAAIMELAARVRDLDIPEDSNIVTFNMQRYGLLDNIYRQGAHFGVRAARMDRNRNAMDRYVYAMREPNVDEATYFTARRSAEAAMQNAYNAAQRERGMEHPFTSFVQDNSRVLALGNYAASAVRQQAAFTRYFQSYQQAYGLGGGNGLGLGNLGLGNNGTGTGLGGNPFLGSGLNTGVGVNSPYRY